jgi:hypothetical protein
MQLHFAYCVVRMQDSTTTHTDEDRGKNFQYSGLVLERQNFRHYWRRTGHSNLRVRVPDPVACHHLSYT